MGSTPWETLQSYNNTQAEANANFTDANIGTHEQSHMHPYAHVKQLKGIKLASSIKHAVSTNTVELAHTHAHTRY